MLLFLLLVVFAIGTHFLLRKFFGLDGLLTYPIAFALVFAMVSYFYYLSLLSGIGYEWVLGGGTVLVGLVGVKLFREDKAALFLKPKDLQDMLFLVAFGIAITMLFRHRIHRWGDWDAWAIWNLHAKFLADPERWRHMFTNQMAPTHPDYPLMLPSVVALFWRAIGTVTPVVPMLVSNLVYVAVPITVFTALKRSGYRVLAIVSVPVFIFDHKFNELAGSQYADTLLALFILITFIVCNEAKSAMRPPLFSLLGLVAASSAWIKNEGLLFFVVFFSVFLFFHRKKPAHIGLFLVGAALPLCVLVHFKLALAPPNDLIHEGRNESMLSLLLRPDRYMVIAEHAIRTLVSDYWVSLVLIGVVWVRRVAWTGTLSFWVLSLLLLGYFAVYLITPHDLVWHVSNSIDRLLHQVYPACIYVLLMKLAQPGMIHRSTGKPAVDHLAKIGQ
nr:hypothetical protein [uncultured Dyadobacter sp.]